MGSPRGRGLDVLLGGIATAFGAVSLSYPFGRDQGLFYYAAREWLLRGQVLYRDVFDHKPPVIYLIHMLAIAVLGENTWGIRLVELAIGVPAMGWVAARLASPRGRPPAPGVFGAAWLGAAIVQYGYLTFWDSAQCELWYALFATGGLAAVLRARRELAGCAVAGVLSSIALFTKTPCVAFVLLNVGAIAWRVREHPEKRALAFARDLGVFAASGAAFAACVLGIFVAAHALAPMLDILVGANAVYLRNGPGIDGIGDVISRTIELFRDYEPLSGVLVAVAAITAIRGFARGDAAAARRYALPVLLALACWCAVVAQRKFYGYHSASIVAAVAVAFAVLIQDCERVLSARRERWLAPAVFVTFVAGTFALSARPSERWYLDVREALRWRVGAIDREEFARRYDQQGWYAYHDAEEVGLWLRRRSRPEDTVVVRGFEPEIYAISGRHYTGRFFWTSFLTEPWRAYRRDEWLAEDLAALRAQPPRFAVTLRRETEGVDSPRFFEQLGYRATAEIGGFVVLERAETENDRGE